MTRRRKRYKCHYCGAPATFLSPSTGELKGDKQHTLCKRCFDAACAKGFKELRELLKDWEPPQ